MRSVINGLKSAVKATNYTTLARNANQFKQFRLPETRQFSVESAPACWNCQKKSELKQNMICSDCGHLQDVNSGINYFKLLSFPIEFSLESQKLTRSFRLLQTIVHPDKYSNRTSREQTNSADWSSLINKAYKTLSTPIERGQYLLQLEGEQMPQDNSALNKEFLMAMMERNEEVEDAKDTETLEGLNAQLINELENMAQKLNILFKTQDLSGVKETLVAMKYLLSIQNSIKQKQQSLLGS
ncbi:iron-sulfur cluster co-chaperone protein HscB isoform X1 [Drosophila teissieri]|uniref:iron-sulfur cluster co-chaperone protein HscB isoform X1 n=1 Tax=Drosophila teissieri TaxID=7243 RepID=UPI001CB9E385|nr:iron-sulfur cluster co-chaperone protein HscB isoform X1 [Drosophila teissieri]